MSGDETVEEEGVIDLTPECSEDDHPLSSPTAEVAREEIQEEPESLDAIGVAKQDSVQENPQSAAAAGETEVAPAEVPEAMDLECTAEAGNLASDNNEDFGHTRETVLSQALTLGGELVEYEETIIKPRPYVPFASRSTGSSPYQMGIATWPRPKPRAEQVMEFVSQLVRDDPRRRRRKRRTNDNGTPLPSILPPKVLAAGRKKRTVPTLLPSCSKTLSAPKIFIEATNGSVVTIVVNFGQSHLSWLDYITEELEENTAVRNLYDENDQVLEDKNDVIGGATYYVRNSSQRADAAARTGRARSVSPFRRQLISPERYDQLCQGAARNPKPVKVVVRANRWVTQPPPNRYSQRMLVIGSWVTFVEHLVKKLKLPSCPEILYHENGTIVAGVEDMHDGETLYLHPKDAYDSGRDWGKTLSPAKAAVVVAHSNRWSDAPPPSRYTQIVIVPCTVALLCDEMTRKLKPPFPVLQVFDKEGHEVVDVAALKDGQHVYTTATGLKTREMDFSRLSPVRTWAIYAQRVNYGMADPVFDKPLLVAVRKAQYLPEPEQFRLILEEVTRRLELPMMLNKMWMLSETQDTDGMIPVTKMSQIQPGVVYHAVNHDQDDY